MAKNKENHSLLIEPMPSAGLKETQYKEWYGKIVRFYLDHQKDEKPSKEVLMAFQRSTGLKMWDASNVLSGKSSLPSALSVTFKGLSKKQMESILKAYQDSDNYHSNSNNIKIAPKCTKFLNNQCQLENAPKDCPNSGNIPYEECNRFQTWGQCALFVDLENICIPLENKKKQLRVDQLIKHIVKSGNLQRNRDLILGRFYGESHKYRHFKDWIKKEGLSFIDCESQFSPKSHDSSMKNHDISGFSAKSPSKNRGDIRLVIEAMELLYEKNSDFNTIILASGDSDFRLLLEKMKNKGKTVIVYTAIESLAKDLKTWADKVFFVERENITSNLRI